jgi:hydroxyethylthiazole kinase-like uncharacterized protein yjeF
MARPDPSPSPVLPLTRGWPLHDATATRALEQSALATAPDHALMARAGLAVARLALAVWPGARRVHAVAGPGNNGGDALVAARWLQQQGLEVRVTLLADPARLPHDAAWALHEARGLHIETALPAVIDADGVLDGLLGLGASRAPEGALADAIRRLNAGGAPILAIDLPSGLDADRGCALGAEAVRATHTLALLTLKPGLFTGLGRDHAGRIWLDRLGVEPSATSASLIGPPAADAAPHASHKGSFGDLVIVGGAPGMAGAALLAARAGLAAGAGRVFLGALDPALAAPDPMRPELMHRPVADLLAPAALAARTVVVGCGGGTAVRALLPPCLAHAARLVLDADALNAVAAEPALRQTLAARGRRGATTVLTPHPLEAARLLDCGVAEVQADRPAAARALAMQFGSVVVLKGSGTVVAAPDGRWQLNATGNARLATAGTGDVLAGWTGGLWARTGGTAAEVAAAAVFRHGRAAEQDPGHGPLQAGDLIGAMRRI